MAASNSSKRIISNSVVLFVRMMLIMIINLYAVRLLLKGLGMEGYGIFNAVAGIVLVASGVSTVMSAATQRYLSIARGLNDTALQTKTLTASINISAVIAIIALLMFETVGLYVIAFQLQYPKSEFASVMILYQFIIFSFICTIIQIPFQAFILANEEMKTFSIASLMECILKFMAAFSIPYIIVNGLEFYGAALLLTSVCCLTFYIFSSKRPSTELYSRTRDWQFHKELLVFSFWMLFGSCASAIMTYGHTTLLNVYFGPIITASFAIALQVNVAFNSFSNNITMAIRPAMTSIYAQGDNAYLDSIFYASNKALLYMTTIIAVPIIYELPTILHLWLGEANDSTILFTRLIIVYTCILTLNNPISIIVHATGEIKKYVLFVETITLLTFPATWLLFKLGYSAEYALYSMIAFCITAHIARMICLKNVYKDFCYLYYIKRIIVPGTLLTLMFCSAMSLISSHIDTWSLRWASIIIIYTPTCLLLVAVLGLSSNERKYATALLRIRKNT